MFATLSPREAFADCVGTPADGATINCTGTDSDGLDATGFTGQTINTIRDNSVSPAVPAVINGMKAGDGNTLNIDRNTNFTADGTGATANALEIGSNNTVGAYTPNTAYNYYVIMHSANGVGFQMGDSNNVFFANYADVSGATYGIDAGSGNNVTFYSYWNLIGTTAAARFADNNTIGLGQVEMHGDVGVVIGNGNTLGVDADSGTALVTSAVVAGDNNTISLNTSGGQGFTVDSNVVEAGNGNTINFGSYGPLNSTNGSLVKAGDDTTINDRGSRGTFGQYIFDLGDRATVDYSGYGSGTLGGIRAGDELKLSYGGQMQTAGFGVEAGDNALITTRGGSQILSVGHAIDAGNDLQLTNLGYLSATATAIVAGADASITNNGAIFSGDNAVEAGNGLTLHNYGLMTAPIVAQSNANITIHEAGQIYLPVGGSAISVEDDSVITVYGSIDDGYDPSVSVTNPVTGEEIVAIGSSGDGTDGDDRNKVYFYGTLNVGGTGIGLDDYTTVEIGSQAVLKTGDTAVDIGDDSTVTNAGTIYAQNHGIKVKNDSTVYNYGTVLGGNEGLKLDGSRITAYNYGLIRADSEGVESKNNLVLYNYGEIYAYDDAVQAEDDLLIVNHGIIENIAGGSEPQDGLDIDYGVVDNYGIIRGYGGEFDSDGIDFDAHKSDSVSSTIYNRQGALIEGYTGIYLDPGDRDDDIAPKTIHNWGTIRGKGGEAIALGSSDDTLIVYGGSRLIGTVELGEGAGVYDSGTGTWCFPEIGTDNDTLDYRASGSAVITFTEYLPETILSSSTRYSTSGTSVIFEDTRQTAASDRATADMVQALGSVLATHMGGIVGTPEDRDAKARPGWATVFGSRKDQDENDDIAGYDHSFGGLVGGFDGELADNVRGGLFFGSTLGKLNIDASEKNEIDSTHVFGGAYATTDMYGVGRLEVSLLGGVGFNDKSRTMMINTTGSGDAELEADYTTAFVSPEAALSLRLAQTADSVFIARPSVRYVGLFTEEIEESGDGVTWSTGSRTTHILEGRFTLSASTTLADANGMLTRFGATAGVIGYTTSGDDVDVAFSAASYSGSASFAGSEPSQVGALGSVSLSTELSKNSILFGEVEGTVFDEDAYAVSGKAGLRMNY